MNLNREGVAFQTPLRWPALVIGGQQIKEQIPAFFRLPGGIGRLLLINQESAVERQRHRTFGIALCASSICRTSGWSMIEPAATWILRKAGVPRGRSRAYRSA